MNKKGDIELETLVWWIIAVVVLAVVVIGFIVLKGNGDGAIQFLKNFVRFGQ
ncbi:MAG: hypothetical protein WCK90_00665 [archaeon]